ncbi:hypothetical protein D4S20_07685 [Campylobacter jejuni]|nr:hypothetical protein [Campylobacter jejuni]
MTQKLKIVFCIKKMKKINIQLLKMYHILRQKQKIYILYQENEKNKHSIVKNVSYFETKAKNLYFVSRK